MTNIETLSERVMSLSGPDREVDAEVDWTLLGYKGRHPAPNHYGSTAGFWRECANGPLRIAPAYTASIDAAMTLVPEGDPAFSATFWRLGNDGEGADPAEFKAEILLCSMLTSKRLSATASTPALALCAAALIARGSQ